MKAKPFSTKVLSLVLTVILSLSLIGCQNAQDNQASSSQLSGSETGTEAGSEDISASQEAASAASAEITDFTISATEEYVKALGRTYLDNTTRWLIHSASGVSFQFTGTSCSVNLIGDTASISGNKDNWARIGVFVNGELVVDEQMNRAMKTITILESETPVEAEISIVKLSEAAYSFFGITSITGTGTLPAPVQEKELFVEFIGDSITCGYGVDDEVKEHHFSTSTEDATKAYAYQAAKLLDADYSLVSFSGYGIISGYSDGSTIQDSQLVSKYYDKLGFSYTSFGNKLKAEEIEWDHTAKHPDVIVVNLGTNDDSWCKSYADRKADFEKAYVEFLKHLTEVHPNAIIVCSLGIMGDALYPNIENAVNAYQQEFGEEAPVYPLKFAVQSMNDGIAADWHPSAKTHAKAAKKLADTILSLFAQ